MSIQEKIWKDIQGYEGKYQVSSCGNIRSINYRNTKKAKVLKGWESSKGYLQVSIDKKIRVHRLVALTFIPNPENKPQINHINGIKTDNRVENLEWCTNKENSIHASKLGLKSPCKGSKNGSSKLKEESVMEIRSLFCENVGIKEISKKYNVSRKTVSDIVGGKKWKHI